MEKENKIIAEFMDLVESSIPNKYWTEKSKEGFGKGELVELEYHSDWDWIMPVVKKIDSVFGENDEVDDMINKVHNAVLQFDLPVLHNAVVEFIKNQNK